MTIPPVSADRTTVTHLPRMPENSLSDRQKHEQWEQQIVDACDEINWQLDALQSRLDHSDHPSALRVIRGC